MDFHKAITVEIIYDKKLQQITGVASEKALVSEGYPFAYFLHNIFISHPMIPKLYPPGAIAMKLNGHAPREDEELKDKDVISLWIPKLARQIS